MLMFCSRCNSANATFTDIRFPTSLSGDGTDAMNTDCDYSSAYVKLLTDSDLAGFGMTFTIGRGNDIVCMAIEELAKRLLGKDVEEIFANMGKTWDYLSADSQLRWSVVSVERVRMAWRRGAYYRAGSDRRRV